MTIELITPAQHKRLLEIQKEQPNLTYFNTGYDYPDKSKWSDKDRELHLEVFTLLSKHIKGFSEFNHFKIRANGDVSIRFQYDYTADDPSSNVGCFTGVGYLDLNELLNGFKQKENA